MPDERLNLRAGTGRPAPLRSTARRPPPKKEPKKGDGLFGWTIFIILLAGFAAFCWMGSYYIFGHPEEPLSYKVLNRFKKLDPPKKFTELSAPKGEFLAADTLLERYGQMTPRELRRESAALLRNYIRNYQQAPGLVPYVVGRYNILDSFELTPNDFFTSGIVAIAQSTDNPQVLLEHVFPAEERMVPNLHRSLLTGLDIPLRRTYDLSAILNVERIDDGRLKVTAIPIHYPSYSSTQGPGGFSLEPPETLNVEAGLPVLSKARILDAQERYAAYRRRLGLDPATASTQGEGAVPAHELIRVAPAVAVDGTESAPPEDFAAAPPEIDGEIPVARALPVDPAAGPAAPPDEAIPAEALAVPESVLEAEAEPAAPPEMVAAATPPPPPTPAPSPSPEVALRPFEAGSAPQAAVASTAGGSWETYAPGAMPRGRLIGPGEARALAEAEIPSERTYLQGDFVVSASGPSGAVLRPRSRIPIGVGTPGNVRVIVQYPAGASPPAKDSSVSRGADRPFLITRVQPTEDGQINVHVREVTRE